MHSVHVVSHTHWDREWYHPASRFRIALVALIDELLDDPPATGRSFLLDGQGVVLEDYLEVRPERASELAALLRDGRIEAGPWYVLADELIPGGEGLTRNLLAGRRVLQSLRAEPPPVLYCPDSFGHPASLPELALGFGKSVVILWRGFGGARWPRTSLVRWQAPSGGEVALYHLTRSGYELGSSLPADEPAARERWRRISAEFAERASPGPDLLLNGADHHARQRALDRALDVMADAAGGDVLHPGTLTGFARDVEQVAASSRSVPTVRGELRDSYGYTWTLQGTLASRAPQKWRYVQQERDLVRDVEPWLALSARRNGASRRHLARAAWKPVLHCQPHDTLCGCSIDQVARAMDARLESAAAQATALREQALLDLVGHDREAARSRVADWSPVVLVRNRAARARSGIAMAEVVVKLDDVPVGPGSAAGETTRALRDPATVDAVVTHERTESPRAYPDNDAVLRFHTALWVDHAPPYGVLAIPMDAVPALVPPAALSVKATARSLANDRLRVSWDRRGRVGLQDRATGRRITNLFAWESRVDGGDLYTPSIRGPKLRPRLVATTLLEKGPAIGVVEQHWLLSSPGEQVELRLRIVLEAGSGLLRFGVLGDNAARDHRLRLVVHTGLARARTFADAAFGVVERRALRVPKRDARMEVPVPTAPMHRYVSLVSGRQGATVYADGCTEYESRGGDVALTLLRSVGELSRRHLPERPGHAGWPESTPEAQCIGVFQAEFALLLHGARSAAVIDAIERAADDALFPLVGSTLRSALSIPEPVAGLELTGRGLAFSAAKESEDGRWLVLRCFNLRTDDVDGAWRVPGLHLAEARASRLDETPLDRLDTDGDVVRFRAPARSVVTVLVR